MPLLLHEIEVFYEAQSCLMRARPCLVKISCFELVLFSSQHELTCGLKMTKKMIELGFLVCIKVVSLDVI